jgi:hypothetical protein
MRLPISRRAVCVLTALLTAFVVCPPAGAQAAKAPRPLVEITSPAAGSTGTGINLVVSGTARGATTVAVTIGEDVNTYEVWVVKSKWSTFVNPQPAGPTQICAEARDSSGTALGRSCITYTVAVDGVYLSLFPEDGSNVQSTFSAVGGCHDGSTVRLTLDGSSMVLPCVTYSFEHEYVAVPEGAHTLTADQLALDGTTVVASVTRTFTSSPVPVATVAITAPPDGASSGIPQVTFSGTAESNVDNVVRLYVDGTFTLATTAVDGEWSATLTLPWGPSLVCAEMSDFLGRPIATDCVSHVVALDPSSLSVTSPAEGEVTGSDVRVEGTCVLDLLVTVEVDGQSSTMQCANDAFYTQFFSVTGGPQTLLATMRATDDQTVTTSVTFTVDTVAPDSPVVTSPAPGTTITTRQFTLAGTAEPNTTVRLFTPDGEPFYSSAEVDSSGAWTIGVAEDYLQAAGVVTGRRGTLTLTLDAVDRFGNTSAPTSVTYATRIR